MGTDQDESGYQRQFNAAVSVIQSLPKSGSYRPSYEEMLRFYSYYKQATVGPCNITRPGFWDPIGRYKWDAWNKLAKMSQDDAMRAYIREMKRVAQTIIDTVPLDDKTPEMFEPFRPLYEVIPDMPRPPDSFFKTHIEEETFEDVKYQSLKEGGEERYVSTPEQTEVGIPQRHVVEEERSDPVGEAAQSEAGDRRLGSWGSESEDFADSLEKLGPDQNYKDEGSMINPQLFQASGTTHKKQKPKARRHSAERWKDRDSVTESQSFSDVSLRNPETSSTSDMSSGSQNKYQSSSHHLGPQIAATVEALQASVQGLYQRLESLEQALKDQQQYIREGTRRSPKELKPRHSAQSPTLLFILIWPFIVHWILRRLYGRKS